MSRPSVVRAPHRHSHAARCAAGPVACLPTGRFRPRTAHGQPSRLRRGPAAWAVGRRHGFYVSRDVDKSPRRLSGPPVAYPRSLLRRHVQGFVQIAAIIDTTGHAEPAFLEVLSTPDSGPIEPVKQMMVASRFSPGRLKRAAVRVMPDGGGRAAAPVQTGRRRSCRVLTMHSTRRCCGWCVGRFIARRTIRVERCEW